MNVYEALLKIIRYLLLYLIYINQNYNLIKENQTTGGGTYGWLGVAETKHVYCFSVVMCFLTGCTIICM